MPEPQWWMTEEEALQMFRRWEGLREGHFVLASGHHTDQYVDFAALSVSHATFVLQLGRGIAERVIHHKRLIDFVLSPQGAAAMLAPAVAHWIHRDLPHLNAWKMPNGFFVLEREVGARVEGARVLMVDDVVTTGRTLDRLALAVRSWGGEVVGRAAVWLRDPSQLDVIALIRQQIRVWPPTACELCRSGVPISADVGHGGEP